MPQQVKPTREQFYACVDILNKEDTFRLLNVQETIPLLPSYTKAAENLYDIKRSRSYEGTGLQAVLRYDSALFAILALTTFVEAIGEVKDSDEAWVFMIDKRFPQKPCFFSFPMNRTKNFLKTLTGYAKAHKNRVATMPCCPECRTTLTIRLVIDEQKIYHRYTLRCPNREFKHVKFKFCSVYTGMDLVHRKFLEGKFERYFKYDQKNKEKLIEREPDRKRRFIRAETLGLQYDINQFTDPQYEDDLIDPSAPE